MEDKFLEAYVYLEQKIYEGDGEDFIFSYEKAEHYGLDIYEFHCLIKLLEQAHKNSKYWIEKIWEHNTGYYIQIMELPF